MATIKDRIDALKALAARLNGTVSAQALMIDDLGHRIEVLEAAAGTPTPTPGVGDSFQANPAPPEPEAYVFNGGAPGKATEMKEAPSSDYDIDVHMLGLNAWRLWIAGNADKSTAIWLEDRGPNRIGLYTRVDGVNMETSYTYNEALISGGADMRVRRKADVYSIYVANLETPLFSWTFRPNNQSAGSFVQMTDPYNNENIFSLMTVKPTSLVTDRLIYTNLSFNPASGFIEADLDYYISQTGPIMAVIEGLAGDIVVPAAPLEILSNPAPGKARVRTTVRVPANKAGSRFRVRTRVPAEPNLIDTIELTYPGKTTFGQNIANVFDVFRPQRTLTNMFQQGYWQDDHHPYYTYSRNAPGVLDEKGWPIRAGLWFWGPLPDEIGVQKKVIIKWTGGPIDASLYNDNESGITQLSGLTQVDANTLTYTITADRRLATGLPNIRLQINSIDTANPPKNMTMCYEGEDLGQRWLPSFINFLKLLPGRIRLMDNVNANGEDYYYGVPWVWANRAVQDNGAACKLAIEDEMELAERSGRPLWHNTHASYAYETGGMDFYGKTLDLLYGKTQGYYITPGYSLPTGLTKPVSIEINNEIWNFGFGRGAYQYLPKVAVREGFVPPFDQGNGQAVSPVLCMMRNRTQKTLFDFLQNRIPDWRARTTRLMGMQMGGGDHANMTGNSLWDQAAPYIDEMVCAPYIPNDPNAGGQAASYTGRTPAAICNYLADAAVNDVGPKLAQMAALTIGLGYKHGLYEVNVSIPALGLTLQQNKDLQKSPEYYAVWKNVIIPMLASQGGDMAVYSDVGPILDSNSQQWSLMHILGSEFNKSWEAVTDWTAEHSA